MKFNFNLKGRQSAGSSYTRIAPQVPEASWELYTALLVASLQGFPMGTPPGQLMFIRNKIRENDPEFVAGLAIHLRERMDLRSLSFFLSAELAALPGNEKSFAPLVARLVRQAAEIPEWLSYYHRAHNGRKIRPGRPVRKSLIPLFHHLDEYKFSRYTRESQVELQKVLPLLRPKAKDKDRKELFTRILRDQIPVRSTWEQEWQDLQQQFFDTPELRQTALREKWKEGISSFRIGYSALLKNLSPMLEAGVSGKVLKLAAEYLGNSVAAGRSGQSPLQLLEVFRTLRKMEQGGGGMLAEALERAVLHTSWSRSGFGREAVSVIAMDVSYSMKYPVGEYRHVQRFDIAPLLAMLLKGRGEYVVTGIIGNTWKPFDWPSRPILAGVDRLALQEGAAGYAINAHLVLQDLLKKRMVVDKVMIFTDCFLWDNRPFNQPAGTDLGSLWRDYRKVAPQAKLYLFNLAGHGAPPLERRPEDVFLIAGWYGRIFDVLQELDYTATVI